MESSAAGGDPHPSPSGGASPPPPPPPPPPSGWLSGLVSGAGRLLASVLGPDSSSPASSGSAPSSGSASSSPTSLRHPRARGEGHYGGPDLGDSLPFPLKNNQLNQSEKKTALKDHAEASLAIVSDIEPKDAIMQLLMQETYSRSECSTLIKIIQERVVDPDSGGIADGDIALPISWKADRQPALGYSPFSPNVSSPSASSLPIHGHGFDNSAAADAVPTLGPANCGLFNHNADNIQSTTKRRYSVVRDTPEDLRRVRTKIDGNPINITKFKQVDVVRNRTAGGDQKNNESTFFKSCPTKDLKNGFPLKVEPLNDLIPFEQKMMDLSHQKHKDAAFDDSGSVSKLMFMEDIEATPSLLMGLQLQNGSKNRRRKQSDSPRTIPKILELPAMGTRKQSNSPRTSPRISEPPAMSTRRKISDATAKAEIELLEQNTPVSTDKQDPDYVPEKRTAGRPRKGK